MISYKYNMIHWYTHVCTEDPAKKDQKLDWLNIAAVPLFFVFLKPGIHGFSTGSNSRPWPSVWQIWRNPRLILLSISLRNQVRWRGEWRDVSKESMIFSVFLENPYTGPMKMYSKQWRWWRWRWQWGWGWWWRWRWWWWRWRWRWWWRP